MRKFIDTLKKIGLFFGIFIMLLSALAFVVGGIAFVNDIENHIIESSEKSKKYERMQFVKDSLTVEALKRKLEIYEKDSTEKGRTTR